jgi:signal recognition particle receptor subunit beta
MHINWKLREIDIKIVYYGPPLSGKTTNLEQIHARMAGPKQNQLVSLKTEGDRTLFFDFLPLELGEIGGLKPRFNLYTVPGQSLYRDTRRLILEDVDGLVFVADSQRARLADNERAFHEMKRHLHSLGYLWFELPLVMQYNKQDQPRRVSVAALQRRLNPDNSLPYFSSVAIKGTGVIETLKQIINMVLMKAQQQV